MKCLSISLRLNMKKIILYILVIIWMVVIFMFSNQKSDESTKQSSRVIDLIITVTEKINNKKLTDIERENIYNVLSHPVRKLAHVTIYLILGIIVCNIVLLYKIDLKNILLLSILFCILYSISDEIHQIFVSGRSGNIKDVIIDTCGSYLGIFFTYTIYSKNRKNCKK